MLSRWISYLLLFTTTTCQAIATYPLPDAGNDLVGQMQTVYAQSRDNLTAIAQRYHVGNAELINANPSLADQHMQAWQTVIIPSFYVLPPGPRQGIVINLSEMRLYYYPPYENVVVIAPISVGREGWETPTTQTEIIEKVASPAWHVPASIKEYALSLGKELPDIMPPGPNNPMGKYALRLGLRTYLIHGTNDPLTIGQRNSAGCIRMYPDDIEYLFYEVPLNTPVRIINEAYKAGWYDGQLYLEAHPPIDNGIAIDQPRPYPQVINEKSSSKNFDWSHILKVVNASKGYPEIIM
jgi:L,D-transpeptidase ErfK/SrfK